jgi:hypothetical protein
VTVNCICPGWTETAIIEPQIEARAAEAGGDRAAGIQALLREKQPSLRTSLPDEIAALALWLCAPAAHNVRASPSQSMAAGPRSSYLVRMRPRAVEQWRPSLREACHLADPHVGSPP